MPRLDLPFRATFATGFAASKIPVVASESGTPRQSPAFQELPDEVV
jgi:hypothetical protein